MKPVAFIDLFCGMGGFTLGAINAGATCIVSVDYWIMERYDSQEACRVHRANHPYVRVECIKLGHPDQWRFFKRMVDDYRRRGYHIHIHGSPPCQALSNASTRSAEDGMPLVLWFLDLVEKCEPDSWSMENVVPVRKKLPEGVPSVVLNSADFGVPQTRRRCYAGEGWAAQPSHAKEEWVSVIEALPHLGDEVVCDILAREQSKGGPTTYTLDEPAKTVTQVIHRTRIMVNTSQSPAQLKIMLNTAGCGASGGRRAASADSSIESQSLTIHNNPPSLRSVRLEALGSNAKRTADTDLETPSKTICGSGNQVGPRIFDHEPEKPVKIRSLTLPETLVLQGFNPDYDLSAARTMKSRWTMVGNAVPPPVAEAVIRGIHNDEGN